MPKEEGNSDSLPVTQTKKPVSDVLQRAEMEHVCFAIEHRSGPIPSPEDLAKYKQIDPELVNRIVSMAEAQQRHRHDRDIKVVTTDCLLKKWGQIFALAVAMVGLSIGGFLFYCGRDTGGTVLVGGVLVSLVVAFLGGRPNKEKPNIDRD